VSSTEKGADFLGAARFPKGHPGTGISLLQWGLAKALYDATIFGSRRDDVQSCLASYVLAVVHDSKERMDV
jgi:hypothetical protein